jgi:hypothetical protein
LPLGAEAKSDVARVLDTVVSEYQTKPWDYWQSRVGERANEFVHFDSADKQYQVYVHAYL